jgi:hypothetical protein
MPSTQYLIPKLFQSNHNITFPTNGKLRSKEEYIERCLLIADTLLAHYGSMEEIARHEAEINAYPNLEYLKPPKDIAVVGTGNKARRKKAVECILEGRLFSEHAVAGEATRLGLGTKFLLNIGRDLSLRKIAELMSKETGRLVTPEEVEELAWGRPEFLKPLSLGERHMLQFAWDIQKLAEDHGADPKEVLARQKMLMVLNQKSADTIIQGFIDSGFYGFSPEKVLFMIQDAFYGISINGDCAAYDKSSPMRLHNHGQIAIQQTMDHQVFRATQSGAKQFLAAAEYADILTSMDDKVTYSIEDLSFLSQSIDLDALGFALEEGEKGARMVMEIVANDPDTPQKGGMAAYDQILERNVMIEGFQLKPIDNKDIVFLNKNFNHYPNPIDSWTEVARTGLNMPVTMKKGHLYFQPVQGDINFLVETRFFIRDEYKKQANG